MKSKKIITKILIVLTIIIVGLISFVGIYVQKLNKMENVVRGYDTTKDLSGYREIVLEVSDAQKVLDSDGKVIGDTSQYTDEQIKSNKYTKSDEKINSDEVLNEENYKKVQNIIEKRLKDFGVEEYNISLDRQNGKIYIQLPEEKQTDQIVSNISESGKIEIKDSEDGTILLNNDNLKNVKVGYQSKTEGTVVYLNIQFNKDGTEILKDLSTNKYATKSEDASTNSERSKEDVNATDENKTEESTEKAKDESTDKKDNEKSKDESSDKKDNEESKDEASDENKEEEKQKEVTLFLSGEEITTTSFDEPIKDGTLQLQMNSSSKENNEISETAKSASIVATTLNNGYLPIVYTTQENKYVTTDISNELIQKSIIVIAVIFALLFFYMIIKYKLRGLLATISFVGFLAVYLLLLRYTNVNISIASIVAITLILAINYIYNIKFLKLDEKANVEKEYLDVIAKFVPLLGVSIIFCFTKCAILITSGMAMFWGIILILAYNRFITKYIVD